MWKLLSNRAIIVLAALFTLWYALEYGSKNFAVACVLLVLLFVSRTCTQEAKQHSPEKKKSRQFIKNTPDDPPVIALLFGVLIVVGIASAGILVYFKFISIPVFLTIILLLGFSILIAVMLKDNDLAKKSFTTKET